MSTPKTPSLTRSLAGMSPRHTVAEALDAYFLSKGITPPSREDLANLPPWPKEDADAFERVINEMFEQIDEEQHPL